MRLKSQKGSITIFVLVALLFYTAFLLLMYAANTNKFKTISEKTDIIKEIYEKNINDIDEIYKRNTVIKIGEITSQNYGQYIDLGKNIIGTEATTDDWKIIYNDKNEGKVYAILADYLPNSTGIAQNAGFQVSGENIVFLNHDTNTAENFLNAIKSTEWNKLLPERLQTNTKLKIEGALTADKIIKSYNEKHNTTLNYKDKPYLYLDSLNPSGGIDSLYYNSNNNYWLSTSVENTEYEVWSIYNGELLNKDMAILDCKVCPVAIISSTVEVQKNVSNGQTIWKILL